MTTGKPALTVELDAIREEIAKDLASGDWKPPADDPLSACEFLKVGFRSWGLEAADHSWRLVLSRLDFGSRDPSALVTVYAPNHANAFGDLEWFVFSNAIGVNGGTNYNQTVTRLHETLGGAKLDWGRRIVYLVERARYANAGANNGTFSIMEPPAAADPPPYIFDERMRQGRTISIFGAGSAGKTTLVDGLVASACSGEEVVPGWRPTRRFSALVLDWDEGMEEELVRLSAICAAYGIKLPGGYHYKRQTRPLHDVADEIGAYVVGNKIDIVVVSPMGRAQRNFGENITAPVDEVHEILRSFGTTNIIIDHVTGDNMKGGAQREFGSVRKRDNVRGSYAVDVQSEEPGRRVLVLRNTKADALSPKKPDQAIRLEYEPHWPKTNGTYDTIRFVSDEIVDQVEIAGSGRAMREVLHDLLLNGHLTVEEMAARSGSLVPSVKTCLYRNQGRWFSRLPSGKWEALPMETV